MAWNKRTVLLSAAILTFGLGTLYLGLTMTKPATDPNSWDILIFTQTWPSTLCYTWKKTNKTHECHFPPDKKRWTIHGIWPTKLGTMGPFFCNKTLAFDPNAIYGIQNELNEYWTDIELPQNNTAPNANPAVSNKKSIWFHEWEKHGTCAISLPALDSEFKYFYQGIEWAKEKYSMKDILEKANIKVNSTLNVNEYWKAIRSVLKVNVHINCVFKTDTKEQLLDEIRICFNKNLELTDCDGIKRTRSGVKTSTPLTNCDLKKPILYLDHITPSNVSVSSNTTASNSTNNVKDWDYVVFSQVWPYTFCHKLKMNSGSQSCNFLGNNQWTINGIWPTKNGTSGPLYCNNQTMFHLETLDSIKSDMENQWIKNDEYWGDEWKKHGTCAMAIPALDSEFKYFKQGLDWNKKYPLNDILSQGSIKPNGTYHMMQYWGTLQTGLGKRPLIYCFTDKNTKITYIDKVSLCFDKSLVLIDCDPIKNNSGKSYTNCLNEQSIYFPGAQI